MLFLRGLGWRRGFSAAVLVVGLISAAVAAIGPLYARASSESTLTDELRSGGSGTGLAFSSAVPVEDANAVPDAVREIGRAAHVRGYGRAITGESTVITARSPSDAASSPSTLATRSGQCRHLIIVSGRCPSATNDLLVPQEALTGAPRWRLGQPLTLRQRLTDPINGITDGALVATGRIVGTYRPRDFTEAYWFDQPYFQSTLGPGVRSALAVGLDAIFTVPATFVPKPPASGPQEPTGIQKQVDVDVPLEATAVRLADVGRLRHDVATVDHAFPRTSDSLDTPTMRTSLPQVLDKAARDKRQVQTATLVVVLELSALSLLVLFQVVGGAVEARGDEIALAKLRGLRPWRTVVFALGEPIALLAVAAPLGFLTALGVTHLLASGALVGGTPVAITGATGWALLAAFAGGALAAVLAAGRTVTRPVLEQWRNTPPRPARRAVARRARPRPRRAGRGDGRGPAHRGRVIAQAGLPARARPARVRGGARRGAIVAAPGRPRARTHPRVRTDRGLPGPAPDRAPAGRVAAGRAARRVRRAGHVRDLRRGGRRGQPLGAGADRDRHRTTGHRPVRERPRPADRRPARRPARRLGHRGRHVVPGRRPGGRQHRHRHHAGRAARPARGHLVRRARPGVPAAARPGHHRGGRRPPGDLPRHPARRRSADHRSGR